MLALEGATLTLEGTALALDLAAAALVTAALEELTTAEAAELLDGVAEAGRRTPAILVVRSCVVLANVAGLSVLIKH